MEIKIGTSISGPPVPVSDDRNPVTTPTASRTVRDIFASPGSARCCRRSEFRPDNRVSRPRQAASKRLSKILHGPGASKCRRRAGEAEPGRHCPIDRFVAGKDDRRHQSGKNVREHRRRNRDVNGNAGDKDQRRHQNHAANADAADHQSGHDAEKRDPEQFRNGHEAHLIVAPPLPLASRNIYCAPHQNATCRCAGQFKIFFKRRLFSG